MTINYEYLEEKKKRKGRKKKPTGNLKVPPANEEIHSQYLENKYGRGRRSWIKKKHSSVALKGKNLVKTLARVSGYSQYEVEDILHALACLVELKLAQNIPVIIEGIGLFYRQPHQVFKRDCHMRAEYDTVYRAASTKYTPDKWMRDAMNTTPDGYKIDWTKVNEEAIFAGIRKYYEEKYGKDFELYEEQKYGEGAEDQEELDEILDRGLKYLQEIDSSF